MRKMYTGWSQLLLAGLMLQAGIISQTPALSAPQNPTPQKEAQETGADSTGKSAGKAKQNPAKSGDKTKPSAGAEEKQKDSGKKQNPADPKEKQKADEKQK